MPKITVTTDNSEVVEQFDWSDFTQYGRSRTAAMNALSFEIDDAIDLAERIEAKYEGTTPREGT